MNELRAILDRWKKLDARGRRAALATVVSVEGSAFRRPGARMLISADGEVVGGVSGGCLENDVIERAGSVIAEGHGIVAEYDTRKDDPLMGIGTGCHGIIRVLITPLGQSAAFDDAPHLHWLENAAQSRQPAALATIVGTNGILAQSVQRALWTRGGLAAGGFADQRLTQAAAAEASHVLASGKSQFAPLRRTANRTDASTAPDPTLLVEYVPAPIALLVFGAGHDAIPLVHLAGGLGWEITVLDHRPAWASKQRFPLAGRMVSATPSELDGRVAFDERTAAVIMTHQYEHDLQLLRRLLPSATRYIGILGSRDRTRRLWADLRSTMDIAESQIAGRVFGPVGFDLGAQSPDEIALSIVAEIQAVFAGKNGPVDSLSARRQAGFAPSDEVSSDVE